MNSCRDLTNKRGTFEEPLGTPFTYSHLRKDVSTLVWTRSRRKTCHAGHTHSRCADKLKDTKSTKQKRKLTPAEKAQKKKRQMEYTTIFINGKQKRIKRPPTIDGIDFDDFIQRNADPIWLHQNEMWEDMDFETPEEIDDGKSLDSKEGRFFNKKWSFV